MGLFYSKSKSALFILIRLFKYFIWEMIYKQKESISLNSIIKIKLEINISAWLSFNKWYYWFIYYN